MKQKKIGTTLYVFDTTAYQITEDTDAAVIKIQLECITAFEVLNESLKDKFEPINYKLYCVKHPEWADYMDDYTVSVSVTGNGAVSASPTSGDEGEEITLTVTPESGYEINTLTAASGGTAITITDNKFTMPAGNVTVTATFQGQEFDITCAEAQYGIVSAPSTARLGDTVTITTTPDTNYKLDTLTAMCGDVPVTITDSAFTMPAGDVTITATFVQDVVPYEEQYFTIEVLSKINQYSSLKLMMEEDMSCEYSKNGGQIWSTITQTSDQLPLEIAVEVGDKILFRHTGDTFKNSKFDASGLMSKPGTFTGSGITFKTYGNVMSLLYGSSFANKTSLPANTTGNLKALFADCSSTQNGLTDASNLILPATELHTASYQYMFWHCEALVKGPVLPATTLAQSCYSYMFEGCSSLTAAPTLPATTSAQYCYDHMFEGCSLLDEVIMLLEDIPSSSGSLAPNCLNSWLTNCSTTGTAYVSPNLTSDQKESITYSLPDGGETLWTIEDYVPAS